MVRWCWVNFQCQGVLLIWIRVGQGPTALAVGVGGGCLNSFSLVYNFSFLSPSLWETARYRLKYCLKELLSPKQPTNQPTNHPFVRRSSTKTSYSIKLKLTKKKDPVFWYDKIHLSSGVINYKHIFNTLIQYIHYTCVAHGDANIG